MQNRTFTLAYLMVLMIGMPCPGAAQDTGAEQPSAREQLQHIYTPQSIDQELARLTKDLELTRVTRIYYVSKYLDALAIWSAMSAGNHTFYELTCALNDRCVYRSKEQS
jgi:hypothetical protein